MVDVDITCPDCGVILEVGDFPFGCKGSLDHRGVTATSLSAIHSSERTVIYKNPKTGEVRFPARGDHPIPDVYARQGYQRQELVSMHEIRQFERETGRVHERSNYDLGSSTAEKDLGAV
jgi:hypothetical protein